MLDSTSIFPEDMGRGALGLEGTEQNIPVTHLQWEPLDCWVNLAVASQNTGMSQPQNAPQHQIH
jgi:hypothetical protein